MNIMHIITCEFPFLLYLYREAEAIFSISLCTYPGVDCNDLMTAFSGILSIYQPYYCHFNREFIYITFLINVHEILYLNLMFVFHFIIVLMRS